MYIMIICHWAIFHYNMSFKTIAGRSDDVFWWFPALSEDQENKLSNSPKLSCGFNRLRTRRKPLLHTLDIHSALLGSQQCSDNIFLALKFMKVYILKSLQIDVLDALKKCLMFLEIVILHQWVRKETNLLITLIL